MSSARRVSACIGAAGGLLLAWQAGTAHGHDGVAISNVRPGPASERIARADVAYPVAVLDSANWRSSEVKRALEEVEAIFGQCGVTVVGGPVYRIEAPAAFTELDDERQYRLLAPLPATRPLAVLVDRTVARDVAYAYRLSAPVASRGTAWITRSGHPACLGRSLAHELGHILLDSARHSPDRDNLMFHSCTASNVAGSRPGTRLSERQCEQLRDR